MRILPIHRRFVLYDPVLPPPIFIQAYVALVAAARLLYGRSESRLSRWGLTQARLDVLSWLWHMDHDIGPSPSVLAERLAVNRSTVARLLRGLEADGLVERVADPKDGRGRTARLTEAGRDIYLEASKAHRQGLEELSAMLTRDDFGQLIFLLGKLIDRLAAGDRLPVDPVAWWPPEG